MLSAIGFFLVLLFLGMPVAFAIATSGFAFFFDESGNSLDHISAKISFYYTIFHHAGDSFIYFCRKFDEQYGSDFTSG